MTEPLRRPGVNVYDSSGNIVSTFGGGAATIADGADVAEGSTTDAAVTTNTTGTVSGKLRGLVAILADVWNSTAHVLNVKTIRSATGAETNVASSASSVTILASNANRLGASVFNDSTAVLYLLLGTAAASNTVHTVQMATLTYYEVPFSYTGQLTGIWASANGSARVTELT